MKKYGLLFISFVLCACSSISKDMVDERVTAILSTNATNVEIASANRKKPYYNYYLPSDMGVKEANDTGAILKKNGYNIVMNFNTSNLIINEYYTDLSEDDKKEDIIYKYYTEESFKALKDEELLVPKKDEIDSIDEDKEKSHAPVNYKLKKQEKKGIYSYSGYYDSAQHDGLYYQLRLKRVHDDYYIHLNGTLATFTSVAPAEEVDKLVNSMMIVLKSIRYDKEKILENFSLKYDLKIMEEKFKENNEFIYQNLPSEGYLEDLINDGQ